MIKQERAKDGALLVLDAGDSLVGDQDPAMTTQGASSIEALNRMDYDAITLGPADLSLGSEVLRRRIAEANFPIVSADVTLATTGELLTRPYVVLEQAGRRIGVIGLSGGPAPAEFRLLDGVEAARQAVAALQGQVDAILLLSHVPPDVNQRIADELTGIAAIVEGGAAALLEPRVSPATGIPLYHVDQAMSGHAGRLAGIATLELAGGAVRDQEWQRLQLLPLFADDPAMAQWVAGLSVRPAP